MLRPIGLTAKLIPYQMRGLAWLLKMEQTVKGGILADEMGLGKTIQLIALMIANDSVDISQKTNLLVVPVALVGQWKHELLTKGSRDFNVFEYTGCHRHGHDLNRYDIVITTYQSTMFNPSLVFRVSSQWRFQERVVQKYLVSHHPG